MIQVLISTAIEGRLKEAEGDFDISGRPMGPIILPLSETLDLTRILKYFKNICYLQVSTSDDGHVSRCVKETRAMKKRLQRAKLKKGNLLAEVRFLRKRHRLLTKRGSQFNEGSPSQKQTFLAQAEYAMPLKTSLTAQAIPYEYEYTTTGTSSDEDGIPQAARKDSFSSMEFTHSPETKPLVTKEFQVFWEPLRTAASTGREEAPTMTETAKRKPPTSVVESDLNLSIFKDVPNGFLLPNRTGKRKISWQDQMALKV